MVIFPASAVTGAGQCWSQKEESTRQARSSLDPPNPRCLSKSSQDQLSPVWLNQWPPHV